MKPLIRNISITLSLLSIAISGFIMIMPKCSPSRKLKSGEHMSASLTGFVQHKILDSGIYKNINGELTKIAEAPGHEKHVRQIAEPGVSYDEVLHAYVFEPGTYKQDNEGIWRKTGEVPAEPNQHKTLEYEDVVKGIYRNN